MIKKFTVIATVRIQLNKIQLIKFDPWRFCNIISFIVGRNIWELHGTSSSSTWPSRTCCQPPPSPWLWWMGSTCPGRCPTTWPSAGSSRRSPVSPCSCRRSPWWSLPWTDTGSLSTSTRCRLEGDKPGLFFPSSLSSPASSPPSSSSEALSTHFQKWWW